MNEENKNNNEEKEVIDLDPVDFIDPKEKEYKSDSFKINIDENNENIRVHLKPNVRKISAKVVRILDAFSLLIALTLYLTLSLTLKGPFGPYSLNGWATWWVFFLLVPAFVQGLKSIVKKSPHLFPTFIFTLIAFLFVGLFTGMWHPYWALLLISPCIHLIIAYTRSKIIYIKSNSE